MATERGYFVFLFCDAARIWEGESEEGAAQVLVQAAAGAQWVLKESGGPNDLGGHIAPNIQSLEQLEADFRSDMELAPEMTAGPFARLKALLTKGGWRFVGG